MIIVKIALMLPSCEKMILSNCELVITRASCSHAFVDVTIYNMAAHLICDIKPDNYDEEICKNYIADFAYAT